MSYFYFKAFHIIGFVCWFAGLFYLVRLFVYHAEARDKPANEREILSQQYALMERRLYSIITTPAMYITFICGIAMIALNPALLKMPWLHLKLALVLCLAAYHFYCKKIIGQLRDHTFNRTSRQMRMLNEVPTLFLVSVVLLAVLKDTTHWIEGLLGIVVFGFALFTFVRIYERNRKKIKP